MTITYQIKEYTQLQKLNPGKQVVDLSPHYTELFLNMQYPYYQESWRFFFLNLNLSFLLWHIFSDYEFKKSSLWGLIRIRYL